MQCCLIVQQMWKERLLVNWLFSSGQTGLNTHANQQRIVLRKQYGTGKGLQILIIYTIERVSWNAGCLEAF